MRILAITILTLIVFFLGGVTHEADLHKQSEQGYISFWLYPKIGIKIVSKEKTIQIPIEKE